MTAVTGGCGKTCVACSSPSGRSPGTNTVPSSVQKLRASSVKLVLQTGQCFILVFVLGSLSYVFCRGRPACLPNDVTLSFNLGRTRRSAPTKNKELRQRT